MLSLSKPKSHKTSRSIYRKLRNFYVVLIHLLVVLMVVHIFKPELTRKAKEAISNVGVPFLEQSAISEGKNGFKPTQHYQSMLIYQLRGDSLHPADQIIFLGDSLTQSLPAQLVTDNAINYGIGTDDTAGLIERLKLYESVPKARALVLAVGVNDLLHRDDDALMQNYNQLLEQLPVGPLVFCSLMLPIEEAKRREWKGRSSARIRVVNVRIKDACEARGHTVIDATGALAGDNGELLSDYHEGDGLHLSAAGYAAWIPVLQSSLLGALEK